MRPRHAIISFLVLAILAGAACPWDDGAIPNPPINPTDKTLEVIRSGGDSGSTITFSPPDIPCNSICNATYADGTSVIITVAPGAGYVFVRIDWSGSTSTTDNPLIVVMDQHRTGTAIIGPE